MEDELTTPRHWDTGFPEVLKRQLERFESELTSKMRRLEVAGASVEYAGRNPQELHAGQFAEVDRQQASSILLRKPAASDLMRRIIVKKVGSSSLTLQAVGCKLNGTRDGTVDASTAGVYRFEALPDGNGGAEWWEL